MIKEKISKVWAFIKRRWLLTLIAVVVVIIIIISMSGGGSTLTTASVERGTVISEVSVTGKVKPAQSLDLAFTQSGRLERVFVKVGDKVVTGQTLAHLDNGDLAAHVSQAQASVKAQQANLDEIKKGNRIEIVQAKQAELEKYQSDLNSYYTDSINILNSAYAKAHDSIKTQLDELFNYDDINPDLTFSTSDTFKETSAENKRLIAGEQLDEWQKELNLLSFSSSKADIDKYLLNAKQRIYKIREAVDAVSEALDISVSLSSASISTYKTYVNVARTNVNLAASAVAGQIQLIEGQKLSVQAIQNNYNQIVTGATTEQLKAQEALYEQAVANYQYALAQLNKTILRSPFDGTVTKIPFSVGDIVPPNSTTISIIGVGKYQIEANVSESDISKIAVGKNAKVDLDAYGTDILFDAKVVGVDLSSTVIEGVATYKTTLEFLLDDQRILPGLTANVDILSDKKDNVLYIPTRNVIREDGKRKVKLLIDEKTGENKEVEIVIGLRGSDGKTEIISGLKEGDKIVTE